MESASALIGSRISLISKKDIRYEGTLFTIDPKEATVALKNVKSHGTEGRATGEQVQPSDNIFQYVMFRGCDIKDLHVHETPVKKEEDQTEAGEDSAAPEAGGHSSTSPPPSTASPAAQAQQSPMPPPPASAAGSPPPVDSLDTSYPEYASPSTQSQTPQGQAQGGRSSSSNTSTNSRPPPQRRQRPSPGMGNFLQSRRRPQHQGDAEGRDEENLTEEFDFESANANFDKCNEMMSMVNLEDERPGDQGRDPSTRKYDSSSFFDELSCDALDGKHRLRAAEERQLNTETFGETGVYRRYHRGGRRGRGRGRRGGGIGYNNYGRGGAGGGGYYNNGYNYNSYDNNYRGRGRGRGRGSRGGGRYYSNQYSDQYGSY